jgi:transcriptional regulator with XRE-family HTH domain
VDRRSEELADLIQRVLESGTCSLQQLAEEAGISYDSLYSWAKGRRVPRGENLRELASSFEDRADRLKNLAAELRRAADRR